MAALAQKHRGLDTPHNDPMHKLESVRENDGYATTSFINAGIAICRKRTLRV